MSDTKQSPASLSVSSTSSPTSNLDVPYNYNLNRPSVANYLQTSKPLDNPQAWTTHKPPVVRDPNMPRFIHDSTLGFTFAYRIVNNPNGEFTLLSTISFAHKRSPSGKTKPEMFSRKVGRKITTERINALVNFNEGKDLKMPPNACIFKIKSDVDKTSIERKIEELICIQTRAISAIHGHGYYYYKALSQEQISNSYIVRLITETINSCINHANRKS